MQNWCFEHKKIEIVQQDRCKRMRREV